MTRKSLPLVAALASFGLVAAFAANALADDGPQPPVPLKGDNEKVVAQVVGGDTPATAGGDGLKDTASEKTEKEEEKEHKNPFAGSLLLFDQSATTNSFSKGSQLSYNPLYEWWISPRVYYTVAKHFKFGARFDIFKEFTNHEETTARSEWVVGDPWLTAAYSDQASFFGKHEKSRFSLGVLAQPPLSKASRANGQYLAAGPNAALSYGFDVAGSKSKVFQSASIGLYVAYSHAFTKSTTPEPFSSFGYNGTNTNGGSYLNDQVRSGTLAGNKLIYAINGEIDILENLSYGVSMIWIDQFSYRPADASLQDTATGSATGPIDHGPNDTRFRQLTWFLTSLDYDPVKEFSVGIGYYNLATALGNDGQRRNILWSPDARVFLSITAHLDSIVDDVSRPKRSKVNTAVSNFRAFQ